MRNLIYCFLTVLIVSSCQKDPSDDGPVDPDPPGNTGGDSIYLIQRIAQPYNFSTTFKYNAGNRLISYGRYTTNFDTTTITYNSSGKPVGVVHFTPSSFAEHVAQPSVFIYEGNRLQKIITKYPKEKGTYPADYFTSYNNPLEILGYDSLFYDAKNRVIKTMYYQLEFGTPNKELWEYKLLSYLPGKDSLLQKIESYYRDVNGNFPLSYSTEFFAYDTKPNPFYNLVPYYALLQSKTRMYILSYYYTGYHGSNFFTCSPNNCISTSSNFNNINYTYNSDSQPARAVIGNDNLEAVNYVYTKVKK